ncbi:MAG: GNAT family N-acetyltransferase [Aeromicrobium erythreum]
MVSADVSARLAWPDDVPAIARLQARSWSERSGGAAQVDPDQLAPGWQAVVAAPPDARVRVLVALERAAVRGFVLVTPGTDPDADPVADAEVAELVVDADHRRAGHGSRLLQAAVDTLRADGFRTARWWLDATDDATRAFVTGSGWAPDGAHRELEDDGSGARLKQVRLHTDLTPDA